jgi:protein-L-isoaspartate O-methyltransferase
VGGILVIPEGGVTGQKMIRIVKKAEGEYARSEHGSFSFVPLLKGKNN